MVLARRAKRNLAYHPRPVTSPHEVGRGRRPQAGGRGEIGPEGKENREEGRTGGVRDELGAAGRAASLCANPADLGSSYEPAPPNPPSQVAKKAGRRDSSPEFKG